MKMLIATELSDRPRILITGGATRENIDGIRFISNVSTGQTAAELCEQMAGLGWNVTLLHGQQARLPKVPTRTLAFTDHAHLDDQLRRELGRTRYDAVVHCAAVSDFTVETIDNIKPQQNLKLASDAKLTLQLSPTSKILPNLKEYSINKGLRVVGFKLTLNCDSQQMASAAAKILTPNVDAIVANDWAAVHSDRTSHPGTVIGRNSKQEFNSVPQLAAILNNICRSEEPL
jgi:phosphopantothenoylcysteine decarboxylase/phosphopantothenate--cysteine ligase